jgi:two-component system, response regulator
MSAIKLNLIGRNIVDILLVDDNIDDAELTIRELRKHKMANNLVHLKDGEEALAFIFDGDNFEESNPLLPPRLILLDIKMPKVNGIEVLQKIKSDSRTKMIPVIMLTSSNEDPDIKTCYDLGANSYIVKPLNFEDMTAAVKNIGFYWLFLNQPPVY